MRWGGAVPELLVIDDDPDMRDLLAYILAGLGHVVRTAENGASGLALLERDAPDLLVMDVDMPVLDGRDTAREIRLRNHGLERIPIVLISGTMDLALVASEVGTPYFLTKPCDLSEVVEVVERALRERILPAPSELRDS
jgi:CheY-like chemotaxis protein